MRYILLLLVLLFLTKESVASVVEEKYLDGGMYYVGAVFGEHDYKAQANVQIQPFYMMTTEVSYALWQSVYHWAASHGYQFDDGCNGSVDEDCRPSGARDDQHPVTHVEWLDSVIFANALSEKLKLQPVYRLSNGAPLRDKAQTAQFHVDPAANGYRLPTLNEWHIAARGGKAALVAGTYGNPHSGSATAAPQREVYGTHRVKSGQANASGLYGMDRNVSEWVYDSELMANIRMYYYCGGSYSFLTGSLASCDFHSAGFTGPDIGFRLVRSDVGA